MYYIICIKKNYRAVFIKVFYCNYSGIMKLTKSLFVEFVTAPHVAWWHVHDKNVYEKIMEKLYGEMDGLAVGRAAEEQVCRLFA